jgi:hypothetical protein
MFSHLVAESLSQKFYSSLMNYVNNMAILAQKREFPENFEIKKKLTSEVDHLSSLIISRIQTHTFQNY